MAVENADDEEIFEDEEVPFGCRASSSLAPFPQWGSGSIGCIMLCFHETVSHAHSDDM